MMVDITSPMTNIITDQLALMLVSICLDNMIQILGKSLLCKNFEIEYSKIAKMMVDITFPMTNIKIDQLTLMLVSICLDNTIQISGKSLLCKNFENLQLKNCQNDSGHNFPND